MTRTDLGRYGYDSNGNQTSRPGHSLTYTPFNKVRTIVDDGGSEVTRNVYDSDETRAIRRDEQGTTIYVGGLYERQTTPSGTVHHKLYISGPDGVVAEVRRTEGESSAKEFYPYNLQTFNRYTYGMNNPFRYLDPSGYSPS